MISFNVLGPLEIQLNGTRIEISGPKRRSLLAALLLHHDHVVPKEDLAAELWPEEPPARSENALHAHVSRLRACINRWRQVGGVPVMMQVRYPGYLLSVPAELIDAERFQEHCSLANMVKSTDPDKAVDLLRQAKALWRGPALQDVPHAPIRDKWANRLERQQLLATTSLVEMNLSKGRYAEIVPDLEALVLDHPLEERLYAQLMTALNYLGRSADALEIYQLARLSLAKEVGLSPSPALERQMLNILNRAPEGTASY